MSKKLVKERIDGIKKVFRQYIDAKKIPNADLETKFNELFYGDKRGNPSIDCLIDNSIQSRTGKKTKSDLKRLDRSKGDHSYKFEVVEMLVDLFEDTEKYAKSNKFAIDKGSFLDNGLTALRKTCSTYPEKMGEFYANKAVSPNNISQAVNAMPENNGVSAANGVPAVNPAPNEDCHCNLGDVCRHQVKFG